jgi:predicted Zn-dependent protease
MICYSPYARNSKVTIENMSIKFYNRLMFPKYFISILLVFSLFLGCATAPVTERRSLVLIPFDKEVTMGEEAYAEILKKEKLSLDGQLIAIVERVGKQLAAVSSMPNLKWEFKLIESEQKNAFALPGGKVAIYTGILPVCANEAGLAAVMGHEIAHATARHGAQRMSQSLILTGLMSAASVGLSNHKNQKEIMGALGVGTNVGLVLPFSRGNESEADEIGLTLMAKAGYDPSEAERFWTRFNKMKQGKAPPEFLSTHPADTTRIEDIQRLLPKANQTYKANQLKHGLGQSFLYILSNRKMQETPEKSPQAPAQSSGKPAPAPAPK